MHTTNRSLEGLRGAAALIVLLYHMDLHGAFATLGIARSGYLMVDLFFVLSGFVICAAYGERMHDGTAWRTFMVRRFGRLYPAQLVAFLAQCALISTSSMAQGNGSVLPSGKELLAVLTMSQGLPLYGQHHMGLPNVWSTSCEFFVYALVGALCLAVRGRVRVAGFVALALVGYGMAVYASLVPANCAAYGDCFNETLTYGLPRCAAGFFIGALIAHYRATGAVLAMTRPITQVLAFAVAFALLNVAARVYQGGNLSPAAFAAPLVFGLLVASLSTDCGPLARVLQSRAFQWLGAVSYSVYLTHDIFRPWLYGLMPDAAQPVLLGAGFVLLSYGTAQLLRTYVEVPFRDRIYGWRDSRINHDVPPLLRHGSEDRGSHA